MTDGVLTSPVPAGTALATDVVEGVHIPKNLLVNAARETVNPATSEDVAELLAALEAGTLPTGAATEATLAAVLAKLIVAPATAANQATAITELGSILTSVDGVEGLLTSLLAKVIAAPATEAKQDALKTSIDTLLAVIRPPQNHFAVTPGAGVLSNATRRIFCAAAGTLTVEANSVAISYTVQAGQMIDIVAQKITAAPTGTVGQY